MFCKRITKYYAQIISWVGIMPTFKNNNKGSLNYLKTAPFII